MAGITGLDYVNPSDIKKLGEAIDSFSEQSGRQTRWIIGLTVAIAVLTAVLTVLTGLLVFETPIR